MPEALVATENLTKLFNLRTQFLKAITVRAVDGVSFSVKEGEVFGLVGESGCGKTTTAKCILRLIEPTKGRILFEGRNIANLSQKEMKKLRPMMQIVYQNPSSSLDPRMTVEQIVSEPLRIHKCGTKNEIREKVIEMLHKVGLNSQMMGRLPHQLSGGQRQRVCIARALILNPKFVVLDEPTSSLDVSVQATVLNLLQELREELKLTYLFISHNLCVVEHISDRIGVMYLGKLVEIGSKEELFKEPLHPYTEVLLSAVPIPDPFIQKKRILLEGDPPGPTNVPSGCRFHPRCPKAMPLCKKEEPQLIDCGSEHHVACHLLG